MMVSPGATPTSVSQGWVCGGGPGSGHQPAALSAAWTLGIFTGNRAAVSVQSKSSLKFPASNTLKIGDVCAQGSHTGNSPNAGCLRSGSKLLCRASYIMQWREEDESDRSRCLNSNSCCFLAGFIAKTFIQPFQTVFQSVKWE